MRVGLAAQEAEVAPGGEVAVEVTVTNDGAVPVVPVLDVVGLDGGEVIGRDGLAAVGPLAPGRSATVPLSFRLPPDAAAGTRRIAVVVEDRNGAAPRAMARLSLRTASAANVSMNVSPRELRGRWRSKFHVVLHNHGTDRLDLAVRGSGEGVRVRITPDRIQLPPGQHARLRGRVQAERPRLLREGRAPFHLVAQGATTPVGSPATLVQRPLLPTTFTRVLALLVVMALWASAVGAAVVNVNRPKEADGSEQAGDRARADGKDAAGVEGTGSGDDADGAGGAGGAGGGSDASAGGAAEDPGRAAGAPALVQAASAVVAGTVSGPPSPANVTVLLERVSIGDVPGSGAGKLPAQAPVAEVTGSVLSEQRTLTDEGGRFRFVNDLQVPGIYRVSAVLAGYEVASVIASLTVERSAIDLVIALTPAAGRLSGRVTGDDGKVIGGARITVADTLVTYGARSASDGDGAGTWVVEGLHTPTSYVVSAVADGYATGTAVVELPGGGQKTVDLVLVRGQGTVRGTVSSRGVPVGGITLTLTGVGSDVTRTTTTLTAVGVKGTFTIPALPLGRYDLTLAGEGWLTQTRQIDLRGGDLEVRIDDLRRSTATIQGRVFQDAVAQCAYPTPGTTTEDISPQPCGNVGVRVADERATFSTTTASGTGAFVVSGVPAGTYTVTLERYGYQPAVLSVTVGAGDIATLGPVSNGDYGPILLRLPGADAVGRSGARTLVRDITRPDAVLDLACLNPRLSIVDGAGITTPLPLTGDCQELSIAAVADSPASCPVGPSTPPTGPIACVLGGGTIVLERLTPGAKVVRLSADGFDTVQLVAQIPPSGVAELGVIKLVPLATLTGAVSGANGSPVAGARVFVTPAAGSPVIAAPPTAPEGGWFACSIDLNGDGTFDNGACVDASATGEFKLGRALGSGTYQVIAPVGGVSVPVGQPTPPAAPAVSLDHERRERSVQVQAGLASSVDLSLRRYGAVAGLLQHPVPGGGYQLIDGANVAITVRAIGLPAGQADISRLTVGPDGGLQPGRYRIDRLFAGDSLRYELSFASNGYKTETITLDGGVAFNAELPRNIVLSSPPVAVTGQVLWQTDPDDLASATPVTGAIVVVRGTVGYRVLEVSPFQEAVTGTYTATTGADGRFAEGTTPVRFVGEVTADILAPGFVPRRVDVDLSPTRLPGAPLELDTSVVLEPLRRTLDGNVRLVPPVNAGEPTTAARIFADLAVTARPVTGGTASSTRVSPTGAFALSDLRPGTYEVTVAGPSVRTVVRAAVVLAPTATNAIVELRDLDLTRFTTVTGVVNGKTASTDTVTTPVSGATVVVTRTSTLPDGTIPSSSGSTGNTGTYAVQGDLPDGEYSVTLTADGYADGATTVNLSQGRFVDATTITLIALPATLSGTVFDGVATVPLANASVRVDELGLLVRTDGAGRFSIGNLPPRSFSVEFGADDGRASISRVVNLRPGETTTLSITLPGPVGTFFGLVESRDVSDGPSTPLSGARVEVLRGGAVVAATTTNDGGNFSFASVAVGSYSVTFSASGYVTTTRSLTVVANGSHYLSTTLLAAGRTALVSVVSSVADAPLQGVTVTATRGGTGSAVPVSAVTAADGVATLTGLPPGTWTVATSGATAIADPHADRGGTSLVVPVGTGGNLAADIRLDRYEGITLALTGRIGGASAALAGATVTATRAGTTLTLTEVAAGSYRVRAPMTSGSWTVAATVVGYQSGSVAVAVAGDVVSTGALEVAVSNRTAVVTVASSAGATGLAGVGVTALRSGSPATTLTGTTTVAGTVSFTMLPGTWTLSTTGATGLADPHANVSAVSYEVVVGDPSGSLGTTLILDRYEGITVTLTARQNPEAADTAFAGATVTATPPAGGTAVTLTATGVTGTYAVRAPMATGTWPLSISATGYDTLTPTVTVAEDTVSTTSAVLTGALRTVTVAVVSSVAATPLVGVTVRATRTGSTDDVASVTAGAGGTATLSLSPGTWSLQTSGATALVDPHADRSGIAATISVGNAATGVSLSNIVLDRYEGVSVSVSGVATPDAAAVALAGATVTVTPTGGGTTTAVVATATAGSYAVRTPLAAGTYTLAVALANYVTSSTTITVTADAVTTTSITLVPAARSLAVTVTSSGDGAGLTGVGVVATRVANPAQTVTGTTTAGGGITLSLPVGIWSVTTTGAPTLADPHANTAAVTVTAPVGDPTTTLTQAFVLDRYEGVTVTVTARPNPEAADIAFAGATVTATPAGGGSTVALTATATVGTYAVRTPLAPGTWNLSISATGYDTMTPNVTVATDTITTDSATLTGSLRTVTVPLVSSLSATPQVGVTVNLTRAGSADSVTDVTGAAGTIVASLRPGTWTIDVTGATALADPHANRSGVSASVAVGNPATGVTLANVALDRYEGISVTLTGIAAPDATPSALDGATVTATPSGGGTAVPVAWTGSPGTYTVRTPIAAGTYTLVISRADYVTSSTSITITADLVTTRAVTLVPSDRSLDVTVTSSDGGTLLDGVTVVATRTSNPAQVISGVTLGGGIVSLALPPGNWTLTTAGAPALADPHANAVATSVTIDVGDPNAVLTRSVVLDRYEGVTLTVTARPNPEATDTPFAGATITVTPQGGGSAVTVVATATAGTYAVRTPLAPGNWTLSVTATGYDPVSATIAIAADTVTSSSALLSGVTRTVTIPVTSSLSGTALAGVTVRATRAGSADDVSAVTGVAGTVQFGLYPGTWTLETSGATGLADPHADRSAVAASVAVGNPATGVTLSAVVLDRYEGITVTVSGVTSPDAAAVALAGAIVTATPAGGGSAVTMTATGVTGTYALRAPLSAGTWNLLVTRTDYVDGTASITLSADTITTRAITLTPTNRTLAVAVTSSLAGTGLDGVTVVATRTNTPAQIVSGISAGGGAVDLTLPVGNWTLTTTGGPSLADPHANAASTSVAVTVGDTATALTQTLVLNRYEGIEVTVDARDASDLAASPFGSATVTATRSGTTVTLTQTATTGTYLVRTPLASGTWAVSVTATGYDPMSTTVTVAADTVPTAAVTLTATARELLITVTSSAGGGALAGVSVTATRGAESHTGTTGADGKVALTTRGGNWSITTTNATTLVDPHANTTVNQSVPGGGATADVVVPTIVLNRYEGISVEVTGVTTADGSPVALTGATVTATPPGGGTALAVPASATSGTYVLRGVLAAGTWTLSVTKTDYAAVSTTVTVAADAIGTQTVTLTPSNRTLAVTVTSSVAASPLNGVTVVATRTTNPAQTVSGATAGSGAVNLTLPVGNWTLTTTGATGLADPHADDAGTVVAIAVGAAGTPVTQSLVLDRHEGITVALSGRPNAETAPTALSGATVTATPPGGGTPVALAATTPAGTYAVRAAMAAGSWTLSITAAGYTAAAPSVTVTADAVSSTTATLTASARSVTVAVESSVSATPLQNVTVRAVRSGSSDDVSSTSDASGNATLSLQPGSWTLSTSGATALGDPHADATGVSATVAVGPAATGVTLTALTLDRYEGLTVDLTGVVALDGSPAALTGATVTAVLGADTATLAATATTGRYAVRAPLAAGLWAVTASKTGYSDAAVSLTVVADGIASGSAALSLADRTVAVDVTSSPGGSALEGVHVVATRDNSPATTVAALSDATGRVTLTLTPGNWTLASDNGASLPTSNSGPGPHENATGVALAVGIGNPATAVTAALSLVAASAQVTGTVRSVYPVAGSAPQDLVGATVTATRVGGTTPFATTTATGGAFALALPPSQSWTLTVTASSHSSATATVTTSTAASSTSAGTIDVIRSAATISGTVTGAASQPVAGVVVTYRRLGDATVLATVTTDATGTHTLAALDPFASYRVTFDALNATDATLRRQPVTLTVAPMTPGSTSTLDHLVSATAGALQVDVTGALNGQSGVPAFALGTTATVTLTDTAGTPAIDPITVTTDSNGTATIGSLPTGTTYKVAVTATGYGTAAGATTAVEVSGITVVTGATTVQPVSLYPLPRTVTVTLTDVAAAAVTGASVQLTGGGLSGGGVSATTDSNGTVTFTDVPVSTDGTSGNAYAATVSKSGYATGTIAGIVVPAGAPGTPIAVTEQFDRIRLEVRGGPVGTLWASAPAITAATVTATPPSGTAPTVVETGSGFYAVEGVLTSGSWSFTVNATNYDQGSVSGTRLADTTTDLTLQLTPSARTTTVTVGNGTSVLGGVGVTATGASVVSGTTTGAGSVALSLRPGTYSLTTSGATTSSDPSVDETTGVTFSVPVGGATPTRTVTLDRYEGILATVFDDLGVAFAGATVTAAPDAGGVPTLTLTGVAGQPGTYRVRAVMAPGTWTVTANGGAFSPATAQVTVTANTIASATINFV